MADEERWLQDSLDRWLSHPQGAAPPEGGDPPKPEGYFSSAWRGSDPPTPPPSGASLQEDADEQRSELRAAMTAFTHRLLYAFPHVETMTIDDVAAAAGWIAEMEKQVRIAGMYGMLHRVKGRPELEREADSALVQLAQLKQAYALQRGRIEQGEARRVQQINADRDAFILRQEQVRRDMAREANEYAERLRRETDLKQQGIRDRQHRDFVRYLRGERVFEIREI
ncbi:MAG TPA: hypothetical protein VF650_14475 [Allosphingosinicella sp.]|jgi:hypothetical protein